MSKRFVVSIILISFLTSCASTNPYCNTNSNYSAQAQREANYAQITTVCGIGILIGVGIVALLAAAVPHVMGSHIPVG